MKKLQLSDIASQAFAAPGVGEKNTVSNGPDNGANNCQASHWWNVMRHGTTQQAVDNLLTAKVAVHPPAPDLRLGSGVMSTGAANIIGHANDGLIETGMGQNGPFDNNKIIMPWNESAWGPQLDRIQPTGITYVSLWGCHPGAGQDGADLLYAMAKRCGRAVRGGTGFLYCNNQSIWWENGSQWQVATPSHKPAPIAAPSPHFTGAAVKIEVEGAEADSSEAVALVIELFTLGMSKSNTTRFEGRSASDVLTHLVQSPPIDFANTAIPGIVTANVTVGFTGDRRLTFTIYNDRLAIETKTKTGYYISSVHSIVASRG